MDRVKELVSFGLLSDPRQIKICLDKHYDEDPRYGGPSKTWDPAMGFELVCNGYKRRLSWTEAVDLEKLWEEVSDRLAVVDAERGRFKIDPACAALVEKADMDGAMECGSEEKKKAPRI